MRRLLLASLCIAALAGCGPAPAPAAEEAPAAAKTAQVAATVIGVDPPNGTITLQHAPIPAWGWPAMRMAFKAPPAEVAAAKVGERVTVDLRQAGGPAEITAVRRIPSS